MAQDAATTAGSSPPVTAAPPAIVLPPMTAAPVIEVPPVTTAVPAAPAPTASSAPSRPAARTAAPAAARAPVRPATPVAPPAAAPVAADAPLAPLQPAVSEAQPVVAPLPIPAEQPAALDAPASPPASEGDGSNALALAGLAGLVVLGGAGIFAATRRRRTVPLDAYEAPVRTAPLEPVAEKNMPQPERIEAPAYAPAGFAPVAAYAAPRSTDMFAATPAVATPAVATLAATSGTTDRHALLQRMVAEPPSEQNPFTSHKGRMRRARLILQHRAAQGLPLDDRAGRVNLGTQQPAFARSEPAFA